MNRFFSKLDLRDIKIDPAGSRFPPDADEHEDAEATDDVTTATAAETVVEAEPATATDATPTAPDTASRASYQFSYERTTTTASASFSPTSFAVEETTVVANGHVEGRVTTVSSNGTNGTLHAIARAAMLGAEFVDGADDVLKVSARSRPSAVAGAIAGVVRECGRAEVQAIGAGATNQAVKAVAIARDYLRETGIDAVCLPAFIDVTIENEDRTAIRLVVEVR